jgi:hypothetical protein
MSTRGRSWFLLVPMIAACTVLAWSLGVLLSEDVDDPDYLWEPVDVLIEQRLGLTALAHLIVAAAGFAYSRLRSRGETPPDDVIVPLLMIGIVIGIGYSVVTAPTIGANIGGGLVIMGAPFVLVGLAVVAVRAARRHHRAPT